MVALVATCALTTVVLTPAAAPAARRDWPAGTRMALTFDHRESLKAGSVVRDDSGWHHPGRVLTQAGGHLRVVKGIVGHGVDFPNRCVGCGRAIIAVADARGLDPRRHSFIFGAAIRLTPRQARHGSNVVQKGYFNQAGGQYKLQLLAGGSPSCVIRGKFGRVVVSWPRSIANDRWHRVSCARYPAHVVLRVDGKVRATAAGETGWLSNDAPVKVGGKKINAGNKQFHGRLDTVHLRVLPQP
jgi:Concanavalin A-like lectin/glucanases superfamily